MTLFAVLVEGPKYSGDGPEIPRVRAVVPRRGAIGTGGAVPHRMGYGAVYIQPLGEDGATPRPPYMGWRYGA